ncbi:MAG: hypothetical protein ACQETD_01165 [Pseudomonadota bacterium]
MAYEHGSLDLGIPNPFKFEGAIRSVRGLLTALLGLYLLLKVPTIVDTDPVRAWVFLGVGVVILGYGLAVMGRGIMQLMRFFVGRSVPTSLAANINPTESNIAQRELADTQYSDRALVQMLDGQKNATFVEPQGWIARLIHSIFPKLTFLPFPIRNLAQRLAAGIVKTLIALTCFTLAWFVSSSGLIGDAGNFVIQTFSLLLLIYLIAVWRKVGAPVSRNVARHMESVGSKGLAWVIMMSILAPVLIGLGYSRIIRPSLNQNQADMAYLSEQLGAFSLGAHLWISLSVMIIAAGLLLFQIRLRSTMANPRTDVSYERGDNWQKSVNAAKEIFNQIKNGVLVKRRVLETPNRHYRHEYTEDPDSKEFSFEVLEETQPTYEPLQYPKQFQLWRITTTVLGQVLLLSSSVLFVLLVLDALELHSLYSTLDKNSTAAMSGFVENTQGLWSQLFTLLIIQTFGRLLSNLGHLFWAEIPFQSLLIYCRGDGTYNRLTSRTGKAIHDSKESEGEITRVSVNPVVLVSRLFSVTYAGVGSRNLEYPRHVLEMHKDDSELEAIVDELHGFFDSRSAHDGITNTKMAEQVHTQGSYVERMPKPVNQDILPDASQQDEDNTPNLPLGDEPA